MKASKAGPGTAITPSSKILVIALAFFAGACCTSIQLLTTRLYLGAAGSGSPALLTCQSAFFLMMALGSWTISLDSERLRFLRSATGILLMLSVAGLASLILVPPLAPASSIFAGPGSGGLLWLANLPAACVLLLPAALATGALVPALERMSRSCPEKSDFFPRIYGATLAGGSISVLVLSATLVRHTGLKASLLITSAGSALLAFIFWRLRLVDQGDSPGKRQDKAVSACKSVGDATGTFTRYRFAIGIGLAGITHQVIYTRFLSEVLDGTYYTSGILLGIHLICGAIGAWISGKAGWGEGERGVRRLFLGWAVMASIGPILLIPLSSGLETVRQASTLTPGSKIFWELVVVTVTTCGSSLLMGGLFARASRDAGGTINGYGRWYGVNLLVCAVAGWLGLFIIVPVTGVRIALTVAPLLAVAFSVSRSNLLFACIATLFACVPLWLDDSAWAFRMPAEGERLLQKVEGSSATATVSEDGQGKRVLRVNKRFQMGGTAATLAQERQCDIPVLMHPNPEKVLFLGAGTGITASRASAHPGLIADAVEILPEVMGLRHWFAEAAPLKGSTNSVMFHAEDARRWVQQSRKSYDVIIGDLFHPALEGAAGLYTTEHFEKVKQRLATGGLFCQWLPVHQMDELSLKIVTRSFMAVFPHAEVWLLHFNMDVPVIGLFSSQTPDSPDAPLAAKMSSPKMKEILRNTGFPSPVHLLGCKLAGPEVLKAWSESAALNTDDRPLIGYTTAVIPTRGKTTSGELLVRLVHTWTDKAGDLRATPDTSVTEFRNARNKYLEGLLAEASGSIESAMNSYVRAAGLSLYFTPAYARAVETIRITAELDRIRARLWFEQLEKARPEMGLARRMLGPLLYPDSGPARQDSAPAP